MAVFIFLAAAAMARIIASDARYCPADGAAWIQCISRFFGDNLEDGRERNRFLFLSGLAGLMDQVIPGFRRDLRMILPKQAQQWFIVRAHREGEQVTID